MSSNDNHIKRIFVYYDEFHKYINDNLRSQIEKINELTIVKKIMALTATLENIFKDTGFRTIIQLMLLANINSINYS
jgi:superfamily II DNA or RNA helicase